MGDDENYDWLFGNDGSGGLDGTGTQMGPPVEPPSDTGYGMNNRDLGTEGGGVLTAEQLASLGLPPEAMSPGFDWSKLLSMGGKGLGSLGPIIAAALSGAGGIYAVNQQKKATDAALSRLGDTTNSINGIFGGLSGANKAYTDVGQAGAHMLAGLPQSTIANNFGSIAGNFNPLGTGRGIKLGALAGH
jgi:hypothetical protein